MKYLFISFVLFCVATFAFAQPQDSINRKIIPPTDTAATAKPDTIPPTAAKADSVQQDIVVPNVNRQKGIVTTAIAQSASKADSLHEAKPDTTRQPPWRVVNILRLNFAQTGFFNWSAGGDNSVATNAFFTTSANYKNENWAWDTKFDTEFGLVYTANEWKKSADKIHLSTTFGYTHNDKLYYSFLGEFKTQYAKSHFNDHYTSTFMAPGYLNLGLGADYKEAEKFSLFGLPIKDFTAFISPFIARFTFVLDERLSHAGSFGVEVGESVKKQMGMGAKMSFKTKPMENVHVATTLNLFTPYVDKFFNFVVDWDTVINMKINKYLTTTLNMSLKYDEKIQATDSDGNPIGRRVQFKEILGLGVVYAF